MNSSLILSGWGRKVAKSMLKSRSFKPTHQSTHWNILRGDNVQVIQGPQTGQQGKVLQVLRGQNRILIEGVNVRRRNEKSKTPGTPGKIVAKPCTVHYSNVMLVDPTSGKPTKVSRKYLEDGTKVRVSKLSGNIIAKPDHEADRTPRSSLIGPKDTLAEDVIKISFADYEKYLPYIYASERV